MAKIHKSNAHGARTSPTPESCQCSTASLQEAIRIRAYQLHVMHGRRFGHALDDWLQAEKEVKRNLGI